MARDRLIAWLKKWRTRKCAECLIMSLLALLGGCLALAVTFGLVYLGIIIGAMGVSALSNLASGHKFTLPNEWRLVLTLGFLTLLFFHTLRSRGAAPDPLDDEDFPWGRPRTIRMGFIAAELFVLTHPMKTASLLTYWMGFGPICLIGSWRLLLLARHVSRLQLENLAPVLEILLQKMKSVTREELEAAFPELPWPETGRDLLLIDGVLALKADQTKLAMSEEFRGELLKDLVAG